MEWALFLGVAALALFWFMDGLLGDARRRADREMKAYEDQIRRAQDARNNADDAKRDRMRKRYND